MFSLIFVSTLTGLIPYFIKWEFNKQDNERYIWGAHMWWCFNRNNYINKQMWDNKITKPQKIRLVSKFDFEKMKKSPKKKIFK